MQILDNIFEDTAPLYPIEEFCPREKALFIDIETTGLSKEHTSLYLIGLGYYKGNDFCTKLLFGDEPSEELMLLNSFIEFAKDYTHLIHFNGTKFDIPYLEYKAKKYELGDIFANLNQIDVYQLSKPLRYLLFPTSMRQKCIEDFLNITREDMYNGGELINVYHSYVASRSDSDFNKLITHNLEDVVGMHKIMPILHYLKLKECSLTLKSSIVNEYKDYNDNECKELLLTYSYDTQLPQSFSTKTDTLYLKSNAASCELTFRLKIYSAEMKLFYDNYKDYYYLLEEDACIHKSVAMGLNKNQYKKATRDTCYQRVAGDFIKQPDKIMKPVFRTSLKDKALYFKYPDSFDESLTNELGHELLMVFFNRKRS